MRLRQTGLSIGVLAALLFSVGITAAERLGPRISVKESRYDFGIVEQGTQPEHVFEITNSGDELLEIRQIQPT